MVPITLGCFEEKGDDTRNRLRMAPGTKEMFSKHLGLSLFLPRALTNASADLAPQVHKSITTGPGRTSLTPQCGALPFDLPDRSLQP